MNHRQAWKKPSSPWREWWQRQMVYHGEPVTLRSIVLGALWISAAAFGRGATGYRRYGRDVYPTLIEQTGYGLLTGACLALIYVFRKKWK